MFKYYLKITLRNFARYRTFSLINIIGLAVGMACIIATSSLRRKAQLLNYNKKFKIINIRGNIDTRINKLKTGYCDALVLAGAGVIRSGYEEKISEYLKHEIMMPAVCQGIIGVEYRIDDLESAEYLKAINHEITYLTARAESAFLRHLKGGCQIPIGCFSTTIGDLYKAR